MTATDAPAELARTYLASFLSPDRADTIARRALETAGQDADVEELLSVAHQLLVSEVRLSDAVAADVLVEDVGLSPSQAAHVLAIDEDQIEDAVAEARAIADELAVGTATDTVPPEPEREPEPIREAEPELRPEPEPRPEPEREPEREAEPVPGARPEPDQAREPSGSEPATYVFDTEEAEPYQPATEPLDEPRPRRRMRTLTLVVGAVIVAAIAVALLYQGGAGPEDGPGPASTVRVTSAGTALPAEDGGPGQTQETFTSEEAVVFWFEYEPLDGEAMVELVLSRNGQELINPAFPLPARRTDTHVTLPRAVTEEPGTYTVRVVHDGRTLTERSFEVTSQ